MHDSNGTVAAGKVLMRNVGLMHAGDINNPMVDADSLLCVDGIIKAVGKRADLESGTADLVIDAHGSALSSGLIESHVHPVFGDWTPRQNQIG